MLVGSVTTLLHTKPRYTATSARPSNFQVADLLNAISGRSTQHPKETLFFNHEPKYWASISKDEINPDCLSRTLALTEKCFENSKRTPRATSKRQNFLNYDMLSTPDLASSKEPVSVKPVPWDHPHGVCLRQAQRAEVTTIGGEDPGIPLSSADVAIFMVAYKAGVAIGCGGLRELSPEVGGFRMTSSLHRPN